MHKIHTTLVPDTPTATKTSRDLKESAPVVAVPTANDSKPPQPQAQPTAENKSLIRENSHESEKEAELDRRAPVVSITDYCNMQLGIFFGLFLLIWTCLVE